MRNGLVATTADRRAEGESAVAWMARLGGRVVHLTTEDDACFAAIVTTGGPADAVHTGPGTRGASIGIGDVLPATLFDGRELPAHTVAVSVDPTGQRCLVGAGAGNMRLFRHDDGTGALVSTSVGAIAHALGTRSELDRSYEDFQLGFGFLPDERTMFRDVQSLPRPCIHTVVGEHPATAEESSRVADVAESPRDVAGIAALFLEILDELTEGVDHVGVLLGGFDSALVASGLHRIGKHVSTFTFDFEDPRYNQRHIDEVVAVANAEHHPVPITASSIGTALERLPELVNQPGAQPHYQIQTIAAAEAARDVGVDRLLTGDGCDALFLAFPTVNTRAAATKTLGRIPGPVTRAALALLSTRPAEARLGHVARVGRSSLRSSLLGPPASQHLPTRYLDQVTLGRLDASSRPPQAETIESVQNRLAAGVRDLDPVQRAFDGNTRAGHSQAKVEGAMLRSGLTIQSPYTHPRFRTAIAQLPVHLVRPGGRLAGAEGKPVLALAALEARLLPASVVEQPKQSPTLAPVDQWFAGPLRGQVVRQLEDLPFPVNLDVIGEILRPKRIEDWYRRDLALSRHVFQAIGLLVSYAAFASLARR